MNFEIQIAGPKKFLITSILFGGTGILILYNLFKTDEKSGLLIWSLPVSILVFSLIFFVIWIDTFKNHIPVGVDDIPPKYGFFVVGYLFIAAGIVMSAAEFSYNFLPDEIAVKFAYWTGSLLFLIPGLIMLIVFFKNRSGALSSELIVKAEEKIGAAIGAAVGVFTLFGMLIFGIVITITAKNQEETILGIIFTATSIGFILLFGVIFYFVRKE